MSITVYHIDSEHWKGFYEDAFLVQSILNDFDSYVAVASVDTDDANCAWELTNSVNTYWGDNNKVSELANHRRNRSTCVGDFFQMEDGSLLAVAGFGFRKFERPGKFATLYRKLKQRITDIRVFWTKNWAVQPDVNCAFRIERTTFTPIIKIGAIVVAHRN